MTHPTPHCEQCRYFQPLDAMSGQCHRFPPQFAGDSSPREIHHWRFPTVSAHAWCGEYLPQPNDQVLSAGVSI